MQLVLHGEMVELDSSKTFIKTQLDYFQFDIDSTFVIEDQKNFCLVFLKQLGDDFEIALLTAKSC